MQQKLLENSLNFKVEQFKKLRKEMIRKGWYDSPPSGNLLAKYMIIGIRPGRTMKKVTKSNTVLEPILDKYIPGDYYFTNIVKYPHSDNNLPDVNDILLSMDLLISEIRLVNPKAIISLGNWVYQTLKDNGIDSVKIFHPSYVSRTNNLLNYEQQIKTSIFKT